jgi:lipoyl(octanoyl) transferase
MQAPMSSDGSRLLTAAWFGTLEYLSAWASQRELFCAVLEGRIGDSLMLLEHPHTYTLGRRAIESDLVYGEAEREARGIATYRVDRGGRATYHGPGQLVGYPIVALGERYDVIGYLRKLETALVATAADLGIEATLDSKHTGVWVGSNKLAAIGVKVTRGITMHGFAFNVFTDLEMFAGIVPCGLKDRWVTSVQNETKETHPVKEVASIAAKHLARAFERPLVWGHARSLLETEGSPDRSLEADGPSLAPVGRR